MSDSNISSDITGKKVFFLYPTASVQNQIITELVQQEFEVYITKDHNRLSYILKKYPDSVLFINIDDGMPESEWEKWIRTILSSQPDVKIGVFSSNGDEALRERYVNILKITCGFMISKLDMSKITPKILDILNIINVKGRRKYIRATVERETNASINMPYGGDFINGTIKDISVVGFSCSFDHDLVLAKNSLIKDIQIKLQSMLLKAEAVVFGTRIEYGEKKFVLLFTQRIDPEIKVKIRKYIQVNLQNKIDHEII